jgi:hypothetical protein
MLLVDSTNYAAFISTFSNYKHSYQIKSLDENNQFLRFSDFQLASIYGIVQNALQTKDYAMALSGINVLRFGYDDIDYFTDCLFLEASAYENLGMIDTARFIYHKFLITSSKKYSNRFHGYKYSDTNDTDFVAERNYAMAFCNSIHIPLELTETKPLKPQFYFGSFQPGYMYNNEDDDNSKPRKSISQIYVTKNVVNQYALAFQYYFIKKGFALNPFFETSGTISSFGLALPVQVYKLSSNRFALQFSPFVTYDLVESMKDKDSTYTIINGFPNIGAKLSGSLYLIPKVSIGAYYRYYYYNERNRFAMPKTPFTFWSTNEYDVSAYINVMKHLTFKAGIKNNDWVVGIFASGVELSWSILKRGFVLRTCLF